MRIKLFLVILSPTPTKAEASSISIHNYNSVNWLTQIVLLIKITNSTLFIVTFIINKPINNLLI